MQQIRAVLDEARRTRSVNFVYFEGGEPFLYYPLMLEGIRMAGERGFQAGIVTNCYWATSEEDAELWALRALNRWRRSTGRSPVNLEPER